MIFGMAWDIVMRLLWVGMCIGGTGLITYVIIVAPLKGWQYLGNQFDQVANMIHPIDNNFYGIEDN